MITPASIVPADIVSRIVSVRGQRVLFDSDLAAVYGVTTKRLNQQVNRNVERFPADFIFHLDSQELANLKLQIATSSLSDQSQHSTQTRVSSSIRCTRRSLV